LLPNLSGNWAVKKTYREKGTRQILGEKPQKRASQYVHKKYRIPAAWVKQKRRRGKGKGKRMPSDGEKKVKGGKFPSGRYPLLEEDSQRE